MNQDGGILTQPNWIRRLIFREEWNFATILEKDASIRNEFSKMKSAPERIWYIKNIIRIKTLLNQPTLDMLHAII